MERLAVVIDDNLTCCGWPGNLTANIVFLNALVRRDDSSFKRPAESSGIRSSLEEHFGPKGYDTGASEGKFSSEGSLRP
ncbi:hypothetical protein E2562_016832 [Oryza meyeriana var. granulata]|uniref:Uncharacterized protein n=1 Tax=Oryza meyeriana var. granulata TaxID=110450 RepID=A0A6G1BXE0_9ORYZ|nr:hypothetical protein E2562_016832 [Oryza meyeriana var. granulata]